MTPLGLLEILALWGLAALPTALLFGRRLRRCDPDPDPVIHSARRRVTVWPELRPN